MCATPRYDFHRACRRPIESRCGCSRGVASTKNERALAIERAEIERLAKDRDDERAILERSFAARLKELLLGQTAVGGPRGMKSGTEITEEVLAENPPALWRQILSKTTQGWRISRV